jgi:mono/diheme cytochrome c family protein
MARGALNFLLLLLFLGTLGLHVVADRDLTQRNFEYMPEMVRSPAYETYAPNPNFENGTTLQAFEPGTIPRGRLPLHYDSSDADAIRAGEELHNPFSAADTDALARGAFVYKNFCQACHGPGGKGDGPVPQRGIPPPASLLAENAVEMKDGRMFHVLTYGWRNMPAPAAQLTRDDRWRVILHIRSLQQQGVGEKRP